MYIVIDTAPFSLFTYSVDYWESKHAPIRHLSQSTENCVNIHYYWYKYKYTYIYHKTANYIRNCDFYDMTSDQMVKYLHYILFSLNFC